MRYRGLGLSFILILAAAAAASAQTDAAAIRAAKRLQPLRITEAIVIDGRLNEPAWALADVGRDFYQQDPDAGSLSSEPSEIRFLYDDDAFPEKREFFLENQGSFRIGDLSGRTLIPFSAGGSDSRRAASPSRFSAARASRDDRATTRSGS